MSDIKTVGDAYNAIRSRHEQLQDDYDALYGRAEKAEAEVEQGKDFLRWLIETFTLPAVARQAILDELGEED